MRQGAWKIPLLCLLLGALIPGCEEQAEPAQDKPFDKAAILAKARQKQPAKERPKKKEQVFTYSEVGKRDPFRSYLAELEAAAQVGKGVKKRQATEEFALDQYRLTGVITGTSQPKALVEDPKGVGHTVTVGSHLGKNDGRVRQITNRGIVVQEKYRNPVGDLVTVKIPILLPKEELETLEKR